jgi:ABC-type sugar transport system ATPase subunit
MEKDGYRANWVSSGGERMSGREHAIVEFDSISKSFGSIQALDSVSFDVKENEVLALMGDNGAGKSTLMKILSGVLPATSGQLRVRDEDVHFQDHIDARNAGIETIYQDLALAPNRTVWDNIFLGKEATMQGPLGRIFGFLDDAYMRQESKQVLERLEMTIDPEKMVKNLSGGQQQAVAVARAVQSDPEIIIMDEPTSALSVEASQRILDLVEDLKRQGITVILIDHNIDEVFAVADRMAVLAQGRFMGARTADELTEDALIKMMMGSTDAAAGPAAETA